MQLDPDICYRAIQTRDARLDGQFVTAVRTTRVYCRPTCPAPMPKRENCTFFRHAAAAQEAGYRPCLRCRPELAPDLFALLSSSGVITKALRLIAEGALDDGTVGELAERLHVTERHLRRLCIEHLGASPSAIAQNRRILFAKHLITGTRLPFAEVALAAGFGSIRRFNTVMQSTYSRAPRDLRRQNDAHARYDPHAPITLQLAYTPPYDWPAISDFLSKRAIPGVESVTEAGYQRTIHLNGAQGVVSVCLVPNRSQLQVTIWYPHVARLGVIVERLRRLFDLHTNTQGIEQQLQADSTLAPLVAARPGLRVPGAWDPFELAVRAILGQQVSVAAATTFAGRLVSAYGEPLALRDSVSLETRLTHSFPTPERLAHADLTSIGLIQSRAMTISRLACVVAEHPNFFASFRDLDAAIAGLTALPGIGIWTAQYIAMRALGESDAFPASDLGLLQAIVRLERPMNAAALTDYSEAWRPWRAYAAMHLWSSLQEPETKN
jgi:AraC family transcriptional regulator of adaptative response / DNA-3-methyladenine glycosylase II